MKTEFPVQVSKTRWIYYLIKRQEKGQTTFLKMLDQDEFFHTYAVLAFIQENKNVSIYAIGQYIGKIKNELLGQRTHGQYDILAKAYSYLLAHHEPALITLIEEADSTSGSQTKTKINPTKHAKAWLEAHEELYNHALENKNWVKK